MKNILAFTLFITLALSACKKDPVEPVDPNQLPPVTETGANILACKVNGKAQVYSGIPITLAQNGVSFTKYNSPNGEEQYIEITGSNNKNNGNIKLYLYSKDWHVETNKHYQFSINKSVGEYYLVGDNRTYFSNNQNGNGHIIFTKYGAIVSGKFAFTAYSNSDSITITEGFFDITPNNN